jgi:hypothetical protein
MAKLALNPKEHTENLSESYYHMALTLPQARRCIAQAFFQQLGELQIER